MTDTQNVSAHGKCFKNGKFQGGALGTAMGHFQGQPEIAKKKILYLFFIFFGGGSPTSRMLLEGKLSL